MKITEQWISPNGYSLYSRIWIPEGEIKATVLLIHGFGEHIKRYDHVAEEFTKHGIKIGGFDQRGFGETCKKNGTWGHQFGQSELYKDLDAFSNHLKIENVPHFIFGHSMGGGIALHYSMENPNFTGVIASAPLLEFGEAAALLPHERLALKFVPFIFPKLAFPKPLPAMHVSRDVVAQEAYAKDPLVHCYCSALTGLDIKIRKEFLVSNPDKITVPLLMVHGDEDKLTCHKTTITVFEKISSSDKTLKVFQNARHELHNELDDVRKECIGMYVKWILDRSRK